MIFAAGMGTRLKPLTDTMPKALVRVDDTPLLEHVITKLKDAGFDRIVVNVHHFANQITDYLNSNDFGVDILVSDESEKLLETGGGLKKAAPLFRPDELVLIHNVDILSNVDLRRFYTVAPMMMCYGCGIRHIQAAATLLVSWRRTKRYLLFDSDMRLVGWTNVETGEVRSPFKWLREYGECHPETFTSLYDHHDNIEVDHKLLGYGKTILSAYAFAGIHTLLPSLFARMDAYPDRFSIIDFYLDNCSSAVINGYVVKDLQLMDVGKIDTLGDAETFLEELKENNNI